MIISALYAKTTLKKLKCISSGTVILLELAGILLFLVEDEVPQFMMTQSLPLKNYPSQFPWMCSSPVAGISGCTEMENIYKNDCPQVASRRHMCKHDLILLEHRVKRKMLLVFRIGLNPISDLMRS